MNYVRSWQEDDNYVENLNGVDWMDIPPPPSRHEHWAQTRGRIKGHYAERCPCGAFGPDPWIYMPPDKPRVTPTRLGRLWRWLNE